MLVTFVVMGVMVILISVVQIVLVEWFDDGGCATEMVLKRCDVKYFDGGNEGGIDDGKMV
jgi:hypothetical protein